MSATQIFNKVERPHTAKDAMHFFAEFFGEQICEWSPHGPDLSLWTFLCGVILRIWYKRLLLEVPQSSRKKIEDEIREIDTIMCWDRICKVAEKSFYMSGESGTSF